MIKWIKILIVFLISSINALSQEKDQVFVCRNGTVSFISEASLELIKATSKNLSGILNISDRSFSFQVPVKSFEGFNSSLQRVHFNEDYMETELFPYSTFKGKIIEEVDFFKSGENKIRAKGKLLIHGVEIDRIIRSEISASQNKIDVHAAFTVFVADHNISIPSILNQKIATEIKVDVRFTFELSELSNIR